MPISFAPASPVLVAADDVEQRRAKERADHDIGQHRVQRVAEPGAG